MTQRSLLPARLGIALLSFLLLAGLGAGQRNPTARLSGVVYTIGADQVKTVWPNARVTLKNKTSGIAVSTVSSELGDYRFVGVEAGDYELTVALAGFETEVRSVKLEPRAAVELDIQLRPRRQHEQLTVTAEQPVVDTTSTSTAPPALTQSFLKSVGLVNEDFQEALPLLPGVVRGPDGLLNIKGARATQTSTLVNSTSVEDPVTGQAAISLPIEVVDSVRVLSNPFSAEYGRFAGGVVEVETRAATDKWTFGLASPVPRPRIQNGSLRGIRSATPRLTLAGPLRKGKLYLFESLGYRWVRIRTSESIPALLREPVIETFDWYTQFDWNINANHRFTAIVSFYPQNRARVNVNTFNLDDVAANYRQRGYFLSFRERAIFSHGGYLESGLSIKQFNVDVFPGRPAPGGEFLEPEGNTGTYYHAELRDSRLFQWAQSYHFRPMQARGTHLLEVGYYYARSQYDGTVTNADVTVVRSDATTSQLIRYAPAASLDTLKNDFAFYAQDRWQMHRRFTLDMGVRLDRDDLTREDLNVAPRLGFVWAATRDDKTAIRGGVGIFFDKVPLNVATFTSYPAQTVTRFAADGTTIGDGPRTFTHVRDTPGGRLKAPYSIGWTLQVDRELRRNLLFRFGYEERETRRDFLVEPTADPGGTGRLRLLNNGHQTYREFQWTVRWQATERTLLFSSYVRSLARGHLNVFDTYFGNYPYPVLRPNQRGRLNHDAPNRFLFWGTLALPWKFEAAPVMEVRDGFPFSRVDSELDYVGPRNRDRFPAFFSLDVSVQRPIDFRFRKKKYTFVPTVRVFNATGRFNPRDVQQNLDSPNFGQFYNSVGIQFRFRGDLRF
jgi:hypothetical protein